MGGTISRLWTNDPNDISLDLKGLYGYQHVVIHTSQVLGSGAYGNVVKADLDRKPCAAKILHRLLVDSQDPGVVDFIARFKQECDILRNLSHFNIVKFLGVVQDPNTNKPILLMELLRESLTHFLEDSNNDVMYHMQVDISHDIALAVSHLHKEGILHRDLSSNNVLLNASHQAKVTDFGMSKIAAYNPTMTQSKVTQCPGTLVYMPPEALSPQPRYSEKIDSFSIGVLLLQIATRRFPTPTAAAIVKEDANSPSSEIYIPVSEIERRKFDIEKLPASHGFLPVIRECLRDKSKDRPTSDQICCSLGQLKSTTRYRESITSSPFEVRTKLHDAAKRGDLEAVKILQNSLHINARTDDGWTALCYASFNGHKLVVKYLLEINANTNICIKNGCSPVYVASQKGYTEVVDLLVQAGADIHLADPEYGSVPLGIAARSGHTETVQRLLELGADPNYHNKTSCTPLIVASHRGHSSVVRLLLGKKAGVNIRDENGFSPVYVASQEGHIEVVDLLVKAGADIHLASTKYGSVPLGIAAEKGHTETVQRLLELGADPNHQSKGGQTSLLAASLNGHSSVVRLLLEKKAGVHICNKNGLSPVYAASQEGHTEVVDLLVKEGANIHLADPKYGSVPLGIAAEKGRTKTVQRLLELGADPNHLNKAGQTPLLAASLNGHGSVVRLLLGKKAGVNICDKNGASPVYAASEKGHTEVVNLLVKAGANIHLASTKYGSVPLGIAAQHGHTETVQRLLQLGADPKHRNKGGSTALDVAKDNKHSEVVQLLKAAISKMKH